MDAQVELEFAKKAAREARKDEALAQKQRVQAANYETAVAAELKKMTREERNQVKFMWHFSIM